MAKEDTGPLMYGARMDAFLNRWLATYPEGGCPPPYQNHFFVTVGGAVQELRLDPDDPDSERIGWDRVQPLDAKAWQRLKEKREMAL